MKHFRTKRRKSLVRRARFTISEADMHLPRCVALPRGAQVRRLQWLFVMCVRYEKCVYGLICVSYTHLLHVYQ